MDGAATARAFWVVEPGRAEIRAEALSGPGDGEVLVRARFSGVSRGTEALVFRGGVPAGQAGVMRAPFQVGEFPGPVKYGYLSVGDVVAGPAGLRGRTVFCLHPHQDLYVVPASAVTPLPDGVPAARAVLAGAMETAVNAVWDALPRAGDRIVVLGGGMIGCCAAGILAGVPGAEVTLVDPEPARASVAAALGVHFAAPDDAPGERDLVVHASGVPEGLRTALGLLSVDGTVLELSWYGDREVTLPLGEAFHARRLAVRSSQVGTLSPSRRPGRTHRDRMELALRLLADARYDVLVTGESEFDDMPAVVPTLVSGHGAPLCHRIAYRADAAAGP